MIANMRETLSFDAGVYLDVYAATDCVRSLIFVISIILFIASVSPRLSTLAAAVHPWGFAFPWLYCMRTSCGLEVGRHPVMYVYAARAQPPMPQQPMDDTVMYATQAPLSMPPPPPSMPQQPIQ